jgi:hypothetical protein
MQRRLNSDFAIRVPHPRTNACSERAIDGLHQGLTERGNMRARNSPREARVVSALCM